MGTTGLPEMDKKLLYETQGQEFWGQGEVGDWRHSNQAGGSSEELSLWEGTLDMLGSPAGNKDTRL